MPCDLSKSFVMNADYDDDDDDDDDSSLESRV